MVEVGNTFELPKKPTCTPGEAAAAIGISERQIRNMIETGELLAISSNLVPEKALRPQWRVVVRQARPVPADKVGLTLEETVAGRMSVALSL
jgi:hypothetical protein